MPDGGVSSLFGLSQRLPPSNLQAEQALLGALLSNNKAADRCPGLRREMFADAVHGRIFAAILRRIESGRLADAVSMKDDFENTGVLDEVGGTAYLAQLLASTVGIINVSEYALTIRNCAVRRELIDIGENLVNEAFGGGEPGSDPANIALEAVVRIDTLTDGSGQTQNGLSLGAALDEAMQAIDDAQARKGPAGIGTGFRCIDERIGGLEPGTLTVIAGRPGMGKSAIGYQMAVNAARNGVGVLMISLEMSARELGRRALATAAGVSVTAMKYGRIDNSQAEKIILARRELRELPLTIVDAAGLTAAAITAKARAAKRKGLGLVVVDHLHIIRPDDSDAKAGPTWAIGRISGAMKRLAKDLGVPVLLLAQLNRGVEGRDDKRPGLGDLRQAGDIEQDADAVAFVYRPEYYLGGEPEPKEGDSRAKLEDRRQAWRDRKNAVAGRTEIIWGKVRDGETGTDVLRFDGPTTSFREESDV